MAIGDSVANMLKDFGLNAVFTPIESAIYNDYSYTGDASVIIDSFGSTQNSQHPFEAYDSIYWFGKRMNMKDLDKGELIFKDEVTNTDFKYSENLLKLFESKDDADITKNTKEFAKFYNDEMWCLPITEKYYIYRIHKDKLSMAPAETGKELTDFYLL